jgi:hypothetical protein
LINVVRDSLKAVPQSGADENATSSASDLVATVDKSTKDEPQESAQSETGTTSGQQSTSSDADAEAGTS